ncbi:gelsolin-like protein 2 [Pomacea canaliculata]|uniref:gelsolin-like protein 2 n=1 Tax=Pomacea canaliculata TaxID=400727 RepID=UPI000D73A9FD|nr:gelsolin-like protein 2 [Pomacea canaliculata]
MSGLVKAKKYDWKDSNMVLVGSETDRKVKKASAETEPAWKQAGKKPGIQIWRINKFKVTTWPTDDYGSFYSGDSYIILNTYKDEQGDKLLYDVHFWIGKESTQDEYGTAAYKTVELDTLLDDVPVQHREVQGYESDLFKSYFPKITYWKGGVDSGFRHVTPENYRPRLLQIKGKGKQVEAKEITLKKSKITSDDVFILDDGTCLYQFNGKTCNKDEKYKASQLLRDLKSQRPKCRSEIVDEEDDDELVQKFFKAVDEADMKVDDDDDDDEVKTPTIVTGPPSLYRLTDSGGQLAFSKTKEGHDISKKDFKSNDVFILDTLKDLFVWIGKNASETEKGNGLTYAHNYLMKSPHPFLPVTCLKEGMESKAFQTAITAY